MNKSMQKKVNNFSKGIEKIDEGVKKICDSTKRIADLTEEMAEEGLIAKTIRGMYGLACGIGGFFALIMIDEAEESGRMTPKEANAYREKVLGVMKRVVSRM